MGVIQNSVNQLLGTSALAAKLSPTVQDKVKLRDLERSGENIKEAGAANTVAGMNATTKEWAKDPEKWEKFRKLDREGQKQFLLENMPASFLQTQKDLMTEETSNINERIKLDPDKRLASEWQKIEEKKSMVEGELARRKEEAMTKMQEKVKAGLDQSERYKELKAIIKEGGQNLAGMPADMQIQALKQSPKLLEGMKEISQLAKEMKENK